MTPAPSNAKRTAAAICAILLGLIFLISGAWKVLSPFRAGELLEQAQVPPGLGVLGAVSLGTIELFTTFLLFSKPFRRWGALLGSALMVFFIAWIGFYYPVLAGKECSCFPIIKRAVNPMFFVEDGIMLLLGVVAYLWSSSARRFRVPAVAFVSLVVLAGISFGVNAAERKSIHLPAVTVNGKPENLANGKVLIFFYDPSCMHCDAAARFMSKLNWDARIVSVPVVNPQWAESFLHDTHLKASTSLDYKTLKQTFPFGDPPYGVAIDDGDVKQRFGPMEFTPPHPESDLRKLGFIH